MPGIPFLERLEEPALDAPFSSIPPPLPTTTSVPPPLPGPGEDEDLESWVVLLDESTEPDAAE
ncbi:MAG: hypothetical protein AAGH15_20255 [Myxococcota bacterium]